jgi:hypothetical protein
MNDKIPTWGSLAVYATHADATPLPRVRIEEVDEETGRGRLAEPVFVCRRGAPRLLYPGGFRKIYPVSVGRDHR